LVGFFSRFLTRAPLPLSSPDEWINQSMNERGAFMRARDVLSLTR
jgi:hypothetical protein